MVTLLKNDFQKEESINVDRELALEKQVKELNNIVFRRNQSAQTVHMLTKPMFFYDHSTRQALGFQNPCYLKKVQQLEPKLYDGSVIQKTNAIMMCDSEESLMLEDESRSKMLQKQKYPMMSENKVNTKPVDYAALKQLSYDFETRFVPQTKLLAEQAFWSQNSRNSEEPNLSTNTTIVEVPMELPKVSMVNSSLKKLKFHLASFDMVVKERTTATAITEGTWGFEHTKACFMDEIIPFAVEQHCVEKNKFQDKMKDALKENERLLEHAISTDIVNIVVNAKVNYAVNLLTSASGSQPQGRVKKNMLEDHPRKVRPGLHNKKSIVNTKAISSIPNSKLNVNSNLKCATCNGCLFFDNHDSCVLEFINYVNARVKSKSSKKPANIKFWKPAGNVFMTIGHKWRPTGRTFTLVGNYLDSRCSKHMTGDRYQLIIFVHKFLVTVKFGNDHVAKIMGYGDYKIGNVTILKVYFVEGLGHNLFSVGQFCDSDLEVAFRQHTCFIRNLDGVYLLTGSQGNSFYTLSIRDMMASSPICLLSKASKTKSWLWHRRLSHLNFNAINHLARQGLVQGLLKLKFEKDHLCSACAMGKKSVNGKKYILVTVDDYSRFAWVKCLRSKDEAPYFIIKFLKMIQVRLKVPVGISHETLISCSPQQNGVVERCNHTLIEAARTMLIYAQALLFLWAEAVATACYTQNRSITQLHHGKTPYELLHNKLPDLSFLHVFGALCYLTNDSENLGKLQPNADIGIFIAYAPTKKAFWIYNRRLVHKPSPSTPYVPPSRKNWDLLFQPLLDELLTPPPSVDPQAPEVIALIADIIPPV
nr:hypothetical protein [Tanacetum cinerariifolium]